MQQKEEVWPGLASPAVGNLSPLQAQMQPVALAETAASLLNLRWC